MQIPDIQQTVSHFLRISLRSYAVKQGYAFLRLHIVVHFIRGVAKGFKLMHKRIQHCPHLLVFADEFLLGLFVLFSLTEQLGICIDRGRPHK